MSGDNKIQIGMSQEELELLLEMMDERISNGEDVSIPPEIKQILEQRMNQGQLKKEIKPHDSWWRKYHHEFPNLDPLDTIVSSLGYPDKLPEIKIREEARRALVIDEVTMRDLKLLELTDSIDTTKTRAGRRMLEYLVHFPLDDRGEIEKRQAAIKELAGDPMILSAFEQCFARMSKSERGFLEYSFPQKNDAPPRQETFQAAREYLAGISQLYAVLKHVKSDKLLEVRDNFGALFSKDSVRKLYKEVVDGSDTDVMALHPEVWTRSLSRDVIDTMNAIAPVMRALAFSNIKTDLSTGEFKLTPRKDGESININYPVGLGLDLKRMRQIYFDENKIFNLYYSAGFLEGMCSLATLEIVLGGIPVASPKFSESDKFECKFVAPADPYVFLKQRGFNPNNYVIDDETRGLLITGPNTGGKTVYGFTLPKLQILIQAGAYVPAQVVETTIADHIFTLRPASKENIGQGRYLHSLVRGREIFEKATPRSFVAIDDFEGTDPEDCYKESLVILQTLSRIGTGFTMTTQDRRVALEVENSNNGEYRGIRTVQLRSEPEGDKVRLYYQVIPGVGASIGEACSKGARMDADSLANLMKERGYVK